VVVYLLGSLLGLYFRATHGHGQDMSDFESKTYWELLCFRAFIHSNTKLAYPCSSLVLDLFKWCFHILIKFKAPKLSFGGVSISKKWFRTIHLSWLSSAVSG